jgi:polar amino acid transport system permease protein
MQGWLAYIPFMLEGALVTAQLTIYSCALALVFAFVAGLGRLSAHRAIRIAAATYVEFFRGTSVFVQLFFAYFVLPLFGLTLTPMQAGVAALSLNLGAYGAEVVRGAIRSIGRDQYEACRALNLTPWQSLRHVIVPQAFVLMLPVFGNNAVELLKGTAAVSLISLADLTFQAQVVRAQTGNALMPFLFILVVYYAMSSVILAFVRMLERRLSRGLDRVAAP